MDWALRQFFPSAALRKARRFRTVSPDIPGLRSFLCWLPRRLSEIPSTRPFAIPAASNFSSPPWCYFFLVCPHTFYGDAPPGGAALFSANTATSGSVTLLADCCCTSLMQPLGSFSSIALPQSLRLSIAQLQHLPCDHQPQRLALHSRQDLCSSQFPRAHRCPLQPDLLWRSQCRGHF